MEFTSQVSSDSVSSKLEDNYRVLMDIYSDCKDIIFRELTIGGATEAFDVYLASRHGER